MTTQFLINNVRAGTSQFFAGQSYDSAADATQIARVQDAGGVLLDSTAGLVAAAEVANKLRKAGAPPDESQAAMIAGAVASSLAGALALGTTGEMAAAGVAAANAAGSSAKAAPIDHAHAHGNQLGGSLHATAVAGVSDGFISQNNQTKLDSIQSGRATLASGQRTVSGVTITASSRIQITMGDPGVGAITGFAAFSVPDGSRVVGALGSFLVQAIDDAKAVIATADCTFDYLIVN
jgi:hypothetical protein